ncbi:hypothetical protein CP967_25535 [Streptomyces nitrosporeus]|uniref:Uncharacterized protein n=1 Tax=Streptomyces nitrosporeus TaxID=28894 RepID=A0A5J6FFI3_9ACTN|nr:hypothetical protein [Streptomyces nitrosporeus]QEU74903.1 hypothetical protein CP967_25535 [Streptomyces nitrosporeus]
MGWTVLYIAFGVVALWLLGEVLLQYKARLRWRLLAFSGFLGVVIGVLVPSVPVIALGTIAFATGQTYVTLSFRRGFSTGWAIGGNPGASRRRRGAGEPAVRQPTLEVTGVEYQEHTPAAAAEDPFPAVHEPQPMPDDTGQYGVYTDAAREPYGTHADGRGQDGYDGRNSYPGQESYQGQESHQDERPYQDQGGYAAAGAYGQDYGPPRQEDPAHAGSPAPAGAGGYPAYDGYGNGGDHGYGYGYDGSGYGGQQQHADPYAGQYASDTPPGGVWVPHQRESGQYPPLPPEAPAPYGNGYPTGYSG